MIAEAVEPVAETERVALAEADGRVLAHDLIAPIDLPPFSNSAVDGYAVRFADLRDEETVLPVRGRLAAGDGTADALAPGTARRIFTGAVLPQGADTVFMQEDVGLGTKGRVHLPPGLKRFANTRRQGEDVAAGARALPAGRRLRPQDLALAAALGERHLTVRRPVRVAVLSTGNEVVEPGATLGSAKLYDANRVLLIALSGRAGAQVTDFGILPDRAEAISSALDEARRDHDLVLTSGGVSTGEEDHVKQAVDAIGRLVFWRLAIKPGRPVAMGVAGGVPLVGLPGNPVAAFVTFVHVARPLIAALGGALPEPVIPLPVRADFAYRKKTGRREYVRVRLRRDETGALYANKHPQDGAGIISSLTETDGLAEIQEPVTSIAPGDPIGFIPYASLI
jgi:molybdopterin molybdotransferase